MRIYNGFVHFMYDIERQGDIDLSVFAETDNEAKEMMYEEAYNLGIKYNEMVCCIINN